MYCCPNCRSTRIVIEWACTLVEEWDHDNCRTLDTVIDYEAPTKMTCPACGKEFIGNPDDWDTANWLQVSN